MAGRRHTLLWILACSAVSCAGFGGDPVDPCATCDPRYCMTFCGPDPNFCRRTLADDDCIQVCAEPCSAEGTDPDCPKGHACTRHDGVLVCSPECEDSLCGTTEVCASRRGACIPALCSGHNSCSTPGDICDVCNYDCFPGSGACNTSADCPVFDGRVKNAVDVVCMEGYCNCVPDSVHISDLPTVDVREIAITSPAPGTTLSSEDDFVLEWAGPREPAIALVFDEFPATTASATDNAIWGSVHSASEAQEVHWDEGRAIAAGGEWLDATLPIPIDITLYALVVTLADGHPTGYSGLIPFRVGAGWMSLGDACLDEGVFPGSCETPSDVHVCRDGFCRRVCLSHFECQGLGLSCGVPREGIRICE